MPAWATAWVGGSGAPPDVGVGWPVSLSLPKGTDQPYSSALRPLAALT
jgi:hypothetical protein